MKSSLCGMRVAQVLVLIAIWSAAPGQACVCDADLDNSGAVGFSDLNAILTCIEGRQPPVPPFPEDVCQVGADVNCDGVVDTCDVGHALCVFQQPPGPHPECCLLPCGACCQSVVSQPCVYTTPVCCSLLLGGGVYHGDGSVCNPSPCDCQPNGIIDACDIHCGPPGGACDVPGCGQSVDCGGNGTPDDCEPDCNGNGVGDTCDVWDGTSEDCNGNLFPDECEVGACCFVADGVQSCTVSDRATCEGAGVDGVWRGPCAHCPAQNAAFIQEPSGEIFIHVVGPPVECPTGPGGGKQRSRPRNCGTGPFTDPWESPADGAMCHNFNPADGADPIPADFFGPGSDPFEGSICLEGVPLGHPDFPDTDTLIERAADPFDPCALVPLPTVAAPVPIEILALSLIGRDGDPITVTYNGGQNPEQWDVTVARSDISIPPQPRGSLEATKTHCNGGTYVSTLRVWPEFSFVRRGDGMERVFTPDDYLTLTQMVPAPWAHYVDPNLGADEDVCSYFHAGLDDETQVACTDCNGNNLPDSCDIDAGTSLDCQRNDIPDECDLLAGTSPDDNGNGVPDECEHAPAPERGTPPCTVAADCTGAYQGADCIAGSCYVPKNRYLSIDPTTNYPGAVAVRVELTESADYPTAVGRSWWVGEPRCLDASNGNPVVPPPNIHCRGADLFGWVSDLVTAPVTRVWVEDPVHVTGCGIVPATGYEVRTSADGGVHLSPPLEIATARDPDGAAQSWGDITGGPVPGMAGLWLAPEGATNFGDVGNAIRTFEGRTENTGAPPRLWVDVESNKVINLGDVQFIISAFEGRAYADIVDLPFIGVHPANCP